ncbi:hypothetical protein [Flavobacterium sp.]|uniref:hypothetical protein n=1 Tax=Flavobacterium sp. TaxID=239 RepID=UPI0025FAABFC|nr:hypothetical protein [Flavobacterium sp.]
MTPKEKAIELVNKFKHNLFDKRNVKIYTEDAIECALIVVDEIIKQWEYIDTYLSNMNGELNPNLKYWYEVKQEIEKL